MLSRRGDPPPDPEGVPARAVPWAAGAATPFRSSKTAPRSQSRRRAALSGAGPRAGGRGREAELDDMPHLRLGRLPPERGLRGALAATATASVTGRTGPVAYIFMNLPPRYLRRQRSGMRIKMYAAGLLIKIHAAGPNAGQ